MQISEDGFKDMLKQLGLSVRGSYRPGEACRILGISLRTFWRLIERYEPDPDTGLPVRPDSLDSFMLRRHRRVRFSELLDYLNRNNT